MSELPWEQQSGVFFPKDVEMRQPMTASSHTIKARTTDGNGMYPLPTPDMIERGARAAIEHMDWKGDYGVHALVEKILTAALEDK